MEVKVVEDFFYNQMKNIFEINKIDVNYGSKYLIVNQKHSEEKLKGTIERHCMANEYELVIFKTAGFLRQRLINPESTLDMIRILYCINGECEISVNEKRKKKYIMQKDDMLVQRGSNEIKFYDITGRDFEFITMEFYLDHLLLSISGEVNEREIENWIQENIKKLKKGVFYPSNSNKEIKEILKDIQYITNVSNLNKYLEYKSKILQLFPLIMEQQKNHSADRDADNSEIIWKIYDMIDSPPIGEIPSIKEMCEILSLKKRQLYSIFENSEGISIVEYIQRKKMEHSKKMLSETRKSIIQISSEIGYENSNKFSRIFKKYYNILPSEYRKNNIRKQTGI